MGTGNVIRNNGLRANSKSIGITHQNSTVNAPVLDSTAILDGEFTVKRLIRKNGKVFLHPENTAFPTVEISEKSDFQIWGVVINIIKMV